MIVNTFAALMSLEGVKSAGSETDINPIDDESITIFFKNGYRLISTKSLIGQSIELDPFEENIKDRSSFKAEVYHNDELENLNSFYEIKNNRKVNVSRETFVEKISNIIGKEVSDFLKERHQTLPFRTTNFLRLS